MKDKNDNDIFFAGKQASICDIPFKGGSPWLQHSFLSFSVDFEQFLGQFCEGYINLCIKSWACMNNSAEVRKSFSNVTIYRPFHTVFDFYINVPLTLTLLRNILFFFFSRLTQYVTLNKAKENISSKMCCLMKIKNPLSLVFHLSVPLETQHGKQHLGHVSFRRKFHRLACQLWQKEDLAVFG